MYPRELVKAMFDLLAKEPGWKPEKDNWWNFYFTANSAESLVALAGDLKLIGLRSGKPVDCDKPGRYIMAARQFTRHDLNSLNLLNVAISELTDRHGVRFDSEDVGPLES